MQYVLPQSKAAKWTYMNLGMTVNIQYVVTCLVCLYVGHVKDWQPVRDVPCLSANGTWDRLQPARHPDYD